MGKYIKISEEELIEMYESNNYKMNELCEHFKVSKFKIRTILKLNNIESKSSKKYNYNDYVFEDIDSEESAYWLGFLYADGYVRYRKKYGYELRLKLGIKDKEHLLKFKKFISNDDIPVVYEEYKNSKCYKLSINSKKIVSDLIKLGCVNNKSYTIEFPKLNEIYINHFMRGYFDGDGSVGIRLNSKPVDVTFNLVTASINFLQSFNKKLIEKCEINERKIYKYETYYRLYYGSCTDIIKIYKFLYKNSNTYIERKKEKFIEINDYYDNHPNKNSKKWN
jgi:hypothetical protein